MTALCWAGYYGKKEVTEYFLTREDVDATLRCIEGFFKNQFADEIAKYKGHEDVAARIAEFRTKQMEEQAKKNRAEHLAWVKNFISLSGVPKAMNDEYAEALVNDGYAEPNTLALLDEETLERDFKIIKKAHRKLILRAAASLEKSDTPYCKAFFFQFLVVATFFSLLVMLSNPNVRRSLKDLGVIS